MTVVDSNRPRPNSLSQSSESRENLEVKTIEGRGWKYLIESRYDEALVEFDCALAVDGESEGGLQGKVATLRKKRLFGQASELLEGACLVHPLSVGLLSERAWLSYEQRDYLRAVDAFTAVLQLVPADADKIVWRSSLLRALRKFGEAEKTLRDADARLPGNRTILTEWGWLFFDQQEHDQAIRIFSAVLAREPKNELALQGRVAATRVKGNFGEATRLLVDAMHDVPRSAGLLSEKGWLALAQGQYDSAEDAFRNLLTLQPSDVFTRVNLAWALFWQGTEEDFNAAADECRKALEIDSDLSQAYGCLGVIAAKQGRLREAESNLLRSIRLDPIRGRRTDLGALYIQMGRYGEAETILGEAIQTNPDDAHAHVELGNLYLITDRVKRAIRHLRIAKAVDPSDADPPRALAIALLESGKVAEAEKVLREALRALDQSKRWQLHLTLCQVLTRVGDDTGESTFYRDALKEANEAIRMNDTQAEAYFYTGIVRYKLGDYTGALKDFRTCTSTDKRHLEADLNARRIQALLRGDQQSRVGRKESYGLAIFFVAQLVLVWTVFLQTNRIDQKTMLVIVPLVLSLTLLSILLPWLSRLKLQGLEAVLSEPKPKETLISGPKGEVGFDTALAGMVGR